MLLCLSSARRLYPEICQKRPPRKLLQTLHVAIFELLDYSSFETNLSKQNLCDFCTAFILLLNNKNVWSEIPKKRYFTLLKSNLILVQFFTSKICSCIFFYHLSNKRWSTINLKHKSHGLLLRKLQRNKTYLGNRVTNFASLQDFTAALTRGNAYFWPIEGK